MNLNVPRSSCLSHIPFEGLCRQYLPTEYTLIPRYQPSLGVFTHVLAQKPVLRELLVLCRGPCLDTPQLILCGPFVLIVGSPGQTSVVG